jgi:hypothetical protein
MIPCVQAHAQAQVTLILNTPSQLPERVGDWKQAQWNAQISVIVQIPRPQPFTISATVRNLDNNSTLFRTTGQTRQFQTSAVPRPLFATDIFPAGSFDYDRSVAEAVIRSGMIPEGQYELCVSALAPTGQTLATQCRQFLVVIPDPPSLIAPANGDTLARAGTGITAIANAPNPPLLPMFQWTPVIAGAARQPRYRLRVVPLFDGQQPRQALEGNPVLVDKIVVGSNYQWLPSDPMFSNYPSAKGFAWQVQSVESGTSITAPTNVTPSIGAGLRTIARNEGRSEMFVFGVGKTNNNKSGTQNYKPVGGVMPKFPAFPLLSLNTTVQGKLNFAFPSDLATKKPLKGATVQLVQYYVLRNATLNGTQQGAIFADQFGQYSNDRKVMATGVTDGAGNFTLKFIQTDSTGLYAKNEVKEKGIGEFKKKYEGNLWRVFRLVVVGEHQHYYTSPDDDIVVQPGEVKSIQPMTANVREYSLTVKVVNKETKQVLQSGAEVQLIRKIGVSSAIPTDDEGTLKPQEMWKGSLDGKTGKIIGQGVVNSDGNVVFKRLVQQFSDDEAYYINAIAKEGKSNFSCEMKSFGTTANTMDYLVNKQFIPEFHDTRTFNSEYQPKQWPAQIWANPKDPTISGRIVGTQDIAKGLAGITFDIVGAGNLDVDGKSGAYTVRRFSVVTNDDGYFATTQSIGQQEELDGSTGKWKAAKKKWMPNGLKWGAYILASGYKSRSLDFGILFKGEKFEQNEPPIALELKAIVSGKIVDGDDPSVEVPAYVRIGDVGVNAAVKTYVNGLLEGMFTASAVPGNSVRVIITPLDDSTYLPETLFVSIKDKADLQGLGDLKVWKRGYRLQIKVAKSSGPSGVGNTATDGIAGATIKLNVKDAKGNPLTYKTGSDGEVKFFLVNNAKSITLSVKPPPKTNFIGEELTVSGLTESKYPRFVSVILQEGAMLTGTVRVGKAANAKPVAKARVYVEQSGLIVQTFTDTAGKYTLYGVEPSEGNQPRLVRAVKSSKESQLYASFQQFEGGTLTMDGQSGNLQTGNVTFKTTSKTTEKTIVGDSASVALKAGATTTHDFILSVYEDMDIRSLLGYGIELTALTDNSTNKKTDVSISGNIVDFPKNAVFAPDMGDNLLSFNDIKVLPSKLAASGVPKAVPVSSSVQLDQTVMPLTLGKAFSGELRAQQLTNTITDKKANTELLRIYKEKDESGTLSGTVEILPVSFPTPPSNLSLKQGLYLAGEGTALIGVGGLSPTQPNKSKPKQSTQVKTTLQMVIPVFRGESGSASNSSASTMPTAYNVVNAKGEGLAFSIYGFDAESASGAARFTTGTSGDSITLSSTIAVSVEHAGDWDLSAKAVITKSAVSVLTNAEKLSMKLGAQWTLNADSWGFANGKFTLPKGVIQTSVATLPFTNLFLQANGKDNASNKKKFTLVADKNSLDWSKFSIGGILPITIKTDTTFFGYDAGADSGKGSWKMQIGNGNGVAASIKNLPKCNPNDAVQLGAISILSSEEKAQFSVLPTAVTVHALFPFKPQYVLYYPLDKVVTIQGAMDLGIPGAPVQSTALSYKNTGSAEKPTATFSHIDRFQNLKIVPAGAVTLDFSADYLNNKTGNKIDMAATQKFGEKLFEAVGYVYEKDSIGQTIVEFKVKMRRTANETTVSIEQADDKQIVDYGSGQKLERITGAMLASVGAGAAWQKNPDILVFEGDLTGAQGVQSAGDPTKKYQHLKFGVKGDIVCNSDKIGVENFDAGFGGMAITYDFGRKALIGSLSITQDLDFVSLDGKAQFLLGSPGWYLAAGAFATLQAMNASGTALVVIGSATMDGDVEAIAKLSSAYYVMTRDGLGGFAGTKCTPNNIPTLPTDCPKAGAKFAGMYIEAGLALPIPIAILNADIDLGIVNIKTVAKVGGSGRFVVNFSGKGTQLGIGIGAYVEAGVVVGASVGAGCIVACVRGSAGLDFSGSYNTGTKQWSATLAGLIEVAGSLSGGFGICDAQCDGLCEGGEIGAMTACFGASGTASNAGISIGFNGPNISKFTNALDIAEINNPGACTK